MLCPASRTLPRPTTVTPATVAAAATATRTAARTLTATGTSWTRGMRGRPGNEAVGMVVLSAAGRRSAPGGAEPTDSGLERVDVSRPGLETRRRREFRW